MAIIGCSVPNPAYDGGQGEGSTSQTGSGSTVAIVGSTSADSSGMSTGAGTSAADGATSRGASDSSDGPQGNSTGPSPMQCAPPPHEGILIEVTANAAPLPPPPNCDAVPLISAPGEYSFQGNIVEHRTCPIPGPCPCPGNVTTTTTAQLGQLTLPPLADGCGLLTLWRGTLPSGECRWEGAAISRITTPQAPLFIASNGRQINQMAFPGGHLVELDPYDSCQYQACADNEYDSGAYRMLFSDMTTLEPGQQDDVEIVLDRKTMQSVTYRTLNLGSSVSEACVDQVAWTAELIETP